MKRAVNVLLAVLVLAGLVVAMVPSQSYAREVEGDGDTMHVSAIDMWSTQTGRKNVVYTEVAIEDEQGNPVKSARVYVQLTTPTGLPIYKSGTTGNDGTAIVSAMAKTPGLYVSTVKNVTHRQFTYAPGDNHETSETLPVP